MEDTDNSVEKQDRPWLFKKGQSGNPAGRPIGSKTLKTRVKEYLMSLTDEEFDEYLHGLDKMDIWKMAEGNPHNSSDVRVELPPVPLDDVQKDNSVPQDKSTKEED